MWATRLFGRAANEPIGTPIRLGALLFWEHTRRSEKALRVSDGGLKGFTGRVIL
jgi:hypothetical protein